MYIKQGCNNCFKVKCTACAFYERKKTTRKTFKFDLGNDLIQMISTFIF